MRVVVLALTLALVAGQHLHLTPEFSARNTYVYKYDAFLLGGLPQEGLAKAGVKVSSKVLINAVEPNTFLLKLLEPEIFEYSGVLPKDPFIKATKLTASLAAQLSAPIKFEYANGVVGKVYAPEMVSKPVLNIYRGILNVLQLNIKKTQNVYELQEAGVQGVCKTLYAISEDLKADRILLTKTKDLNNCQEKIMKDIGLSYIEKSLESHQSEKSLAGAAAYNYVLKQTAEGALIIEATVSELIQFTPVKEMSTAAQMETKQSLVFLEIQSAPLEPMAADYIHRGSLQYEFGSELLQSPIQLIKIVNAKAQIVETLDHLVQRNMEVVDEDAPLKFLELIQLLRKVSHEDLEMIWNQHKNNHACRHWILDAIPVIGTQTALKFIKEKYIAEEITNAEAVQALIAAVHMTTADIDTVKMFEGLALHNKVQENVILREIALLGYGTMVSKFCVDKVSCSIELIRPIHEKIVEATARKDIEEITLLLKVLGNAGLPVSLKPITKVLPMFGTAAADLPMRVHADAILALRNIAKKEPRMIQEVAVQLFMHKALHPELRMLACVVLFETRPPVGLVTTLANVLKREENLQVASFAYSHMKSLTRTPTVHPSLASACNVALKILSPKLERLNYRFSKSVHVGAYNNPLMLGAAASAFYINDASTILPRSAMAKARAFIAGAAADVLEVGVRTEGLQEALLKNPSINESEDRIIKMKRVMKALAHWRSLPTSQPLASVYVKFFGQEIAFANIDKPVINQAIELATSKTEEAKLALKSLLSGISFKFAKPILAAETRRILPTAIGLPMELSLYTSAVAGAAVQVKATMAPTLQEPFRAAQLLNTDLRLETEIKPSVALQSFATMGVNTEWLQAAILARAKLNSFVPAKIVAKLDIAEGNFRIEALPVSTREDIAAAKVETLALARNVEDIHAARIIPIIPVKILAPITRDTSSSLSGLESRSFEDIFSDERYDIKPAVENKESKIEKTYSAQSIGFEGRLRIYSENAALLNDAPLYKLIGKHSAAISVKAVESDVIEKVVLEVQVGPKAAEKIIKEIHLSEDEIAENQPALQKLKKILTSGTRNRTRSFSSSISSSSSSLIDSSESRSLSSSMSLSSSRSSRARIPEADIYYNFQKNHKKQRVATSAARESPSVSSAASFEAIRGQRKFLGTSLTPVVTVIFQVVRADRKLEGLQFSAYLDKPTQRLQLILATLAETDPWKMCADGMLMSIHKVTAKIAWGVECKQYDTMITAETGLFSNSPAARLRVAWNKLPSSVIYYVNKYAQIAAEHVPEYLHGLIQTKDENSGNQISLTVAATSEKTIDIFVKSPRRTYKLPVHLPMALPLEKLSGLTPFEDVVIEEFQHLLAKVTTAECRFDRETLTTFNNRKLRNEMPLACYQVLAQDCTQELKFLVLLKKDQVEQNQINVKIADIDIDLYPKNNDVIVKVNGMEIPIANLPYQHPTGTIHIRQKGEGIALFAPSHGLHEVYFDRDSWKVKVVDWMKGQTCGLCGMADGEIKQEYHTPNGRVTQSAVSYAHSWTLPAESCRDTSECRLKLESVKLERQILVHGEQSKCYSVEPVLRCLPGCAPLRTTPVTVGYHCVPITSNLEQSEGLANIYEKSVDLRETTDAHVACSCTAQCA